MRGLVSKTIVAAAIAGCSLLVAAQASAHDGEDRWDRWDRHHHGRWHDDEGPRRVVVERQPIIVAPARMPAPVYLAPMAPAYSQPADPSVNFNFSFPMR